MKLEADFDYRDFLARLGVGKSVLRFARDQVIFSQGDAADSVFFLLDGRIKVVVLSAQGREAATGLVNSGQFFGDNCLIGEQVRSATTIAMRDCVVASISKAVMIEMLRTEPQFAELFIRHLLLRNRGIEEDLIDQLFNSSEKRLARLLLRLSKLDDNGGVQPIAPHISQETLAEMIGTTRSRVSFFMNKFRKLGLISYDRNIEVHPRLSAMLQDHSEVRS
ncbi:Crp/Fnr family transcriptional regulator [Rhodopseudomonas pseudopalustris]|uniref:Transcriptional regulator, Crp/Fnr family n=1 Tax=Rhodopseudomonas pseudopalustris TaxID=1513892 RepID=A0A1H8WZ33_9BRAD|nr:Crp/Fnr family transcriptional regulator [Rhodopseudomonas pseudopalustris]MBB1091332.1 Crp/Fnr family transcriptional regulator [Rhodopseudomonas palustris]SEP32368.1 transcriptional regulator, Crp/Fnr family [Rhodopseudomonas pseudopalustris]